jgi:hypothetical protein
VFTSAAGGGVSDQVGRDLRTVAAAARGRGVRLMVAVLASPDDIGFPSKRLFDRPAGYARELGLELELETLKPVTVLVASPAGFGLETFEPGRGRARQVVEGLPPPARPDAETVALAAGHASVQAMEALGEPLAPAEAALFRSPSGSGAGSGPPLWPLAAIGLVLAAGVAAAVIARSRARTGGD